jgi:DNA primase
LHDDHAPSLTVYADSQTWHCFGACNRGGDVIDFIMAVNGCDFKEAAALLGGT